VCKGLNICGRCSAGWVLVRALANYLPSKVGGFGWGVDVIFVGWIVGTGWHSCQERAVHGGWVMGAMFCGLGHDMPLEYIGYPNGGIGLYVAKCYACHHGKVRLDRVGISGCGFWGDSI